MVLRLVKVSKRYADSISEEVIKDCENDSSPFGFGHMGSITSLVDAVKNKTLSKWIDKKQKGDKAIDLKPGYVGQTTYWLMDDREFIGLFSLRHELTDKLMLESGHIAYFIRPSKRGQGYASKGLALCLVKAKKRGIDRTLITCDVRNVDSYAVMKRALKDYGGEILPDSTVDDVINHRIWINTLDKVDVNRVKIKE